jgi:hypothetical protein
MKMMVERAMTAVTAQYQSLPCVWKLSASFCKQRTEPTYGDVDIRAHGIEEDIWVGDQPVYCQ